MPHFLQGSTFLAKKRRKKTVWHFRTAHVKAWSDNKLTCFCDLLWIEQSETLMYQRKKKSQSITVFLDIRMTCRENNIIHPLQSYLELQPRIYITIFLNRQICYTIQPRRLFQNPCTFVYTPLKLLPNSQKNKLWAKHMRVGPLFSSPLLPLSLTVSLTLSSRWSGP